MLTFTEAEVLAWVTPILWPFLRVARAVRRAAGDRAAQRADAAAHRPGVPGRVLRPGDAPADRPIALDSSAALLAVVQQVLIGVSLGFAVRIVFAAVEFAGEMIGLQMGLNFAGLLRPDERRRGRPP